VHESREGKVRPRRPWTNAAVLRVLRNPLYAGVVASGGALFPGEHEAIVTPEQFRAVHAVLGQQANWRAPRVRVPGYFLRGVLRCGECGGTMSPASTRRGRREYRYYRCLKREKQGKAACTAGPLPAKAVEDFVVERLRHTLTDAKLVGEMVEPLRARVAALVTAHTHEKRVLASKVADFSARIRRLTAQAEEGTVVGRARTALLERLEERGAELDALQARLDRIERELAALADARVEADWLERTLREFDELWDALTSENQERLVRAVVERVVVDEASGAIKMFVADLASADVLSSESVPA
jgi:hypothetical protein